MPAKQNEAARILSLEAIQALQKAKDVVAELEKLRSGTGSFSPNQEQAIASNLLHQPVFLESVASKLSTFAYRHALFLSQAQLMRQPEALAEQGWLACHGQAFAKDEC